jgi:ribosome-binding factor A
VEVSSDLSHARIFFSVVSDREDSVGRDIEALLNGKRGLVRSEIAQRLVMRQHPELRFSYDETPARAAHIESLLRQISDEKRTSEDRDS